MICRWNWSRRAIPGCAIAGRYGAANQHRGFATSISTAYSLTPGLTKLKSRRLVSVTGKDAPKLLQGLITNNIDSFLDENRSGIYTAFLNSHGRLLTDAFIYRIPTKTSENLEDGFWVEIEESLVKVLCQYLSRHKIRSSVKIQPFADQKYDIWVGWGRSQPNVPSQYELSSDIVDLEDPRLAQFANRLVVPTSVNLEQSGKETLQLPIVSEKEYLNRRCIWGLTEGHQAMAAGRSLPHEFNFDVLNAIDFHKGCYIGQELTIRTQHQGVVRKRILPVQIYPKEEPAPLELSSSPSSNEAITDGILQDTKITRVTGTEQVPKRRNNAVGTWVEGFEGKGLSLCRLEAMTDVKISADQDATSYSEDAEFTFEPASYYGLRVKASVPDWLKGHLVPRKHRSPVQSLEADG
jgi:folate-binding protein YgfZ